MKLNSNPVVNILTIQMEAAEFSYSEIIITNPEGKTVLRKKWETELKQKLQLDLNQLGLTSGTYLVSAINKDSILSKKVFLVE